MELFGVILNLLIASHLNIHSIQIKGTSQQTEDKMPGYFIGYETV
ncbi:hypothetical protein VRK_33200 [Vibrio sp. MEBiC08052]|nr:hypothetical protein VRK_33200 [Vibrio sp. MEBiC08052]